MYVIFPLDQLLDFDSADKVAKQTSTSNQSGAQTDRSAKVLSPTHPVLQKQPSKQVPTTPEDQEPPAELGTTLSAQGQGQKPFQAQEKLSKGSTPTVRTPSALPSTTPIAQPSQQQIFSNEVSSAPHSQLQVPSSLVPPASSVSGTNVSASLSGGPTVQGLQRQASLKQLSQVTPKRKNASACASWAGPPPALEISSEITRSASFFLNRESDTTKVSPISANIDRSLSLRQPQVSPVIASVDRSLSLRQSQISPVSVSVDRSLSLRQPQVTKCEYSRNDIIKSESFRYNRVDSSLSREPKLTRGKHSRPQIPAEFWTEEVSEFDRKQYIKSILDSEEGKDIQDSDFEPEPDSHIVPFGVLDSEVVGSESSARGSSSSTSRSRGSFSVGKVVSPKTSKTLPITTFPAAAAYPRQPSPLRTSHKLAMSSEPSFKDLSYPALNETLKSYNSTSFKLIKTVSEFSAQLSRLHEKHAEDLQLLVENYRKKHSDLRNERPPCASQIFQAWETLLQEVEVDSQLHSDVAGTFVRQVSRPLIEKTFNRKLQSRKLFTHRESIETILGKTEEMLKKCRKDHTEAYHTHCRTQSNASLASYFDAHNAYVQQLHATNAMLQYYNLHTQPELLQELEEVHLDVNAIIIESIMQGADILAVKAQEQYRRYDGLTATCRNSDARADVVSLVKHLDTPSFGHKGIPQHRFILPQPPPPPEGDEETQVVPEIPSFPPLKNELVLDRLAALSTRTRADSLKREATDLEKQIAQLQEGMDAIIRAQMRNLESSLYHKANELQEDISMKRFDLRVSQVHLAAVRAQRELFASKEGPSTESRERKMSGASTGSMKSKWMKAFKSLKTTGSSSGPTGGASSRDSDKKNGRERGMDSPAAMFENSHILQEYTYKKITACDACHQILRGHSRQGLKCRLCKTNVHVECQERLQRCQPKSRLLRRQRSTSEIESKQMDAGDEENEPTISINSLIASQPGRRMKDPPSPSSPVPNAAPQFPKGPAPTDPGKRKLFKSFTKN